MQPAKHSSDLVHFCLENISKTALSNLQRIHLFWSFVENNLVTCVESNVQFIREGSLECLNEVIMTVFRDFLQIVEKSGSGDVDKCYEVKDAEIEQWSHRY